MRIFYCLLFVLLATSAFGQNDTTTVAPTTTTGASVWTTVTDTFYNTLFWWMPAAETTTTTAAPTTAAPTTAAPTTAAPTTEAPTTEAPTTEALSTTTEAPSTTTTAAPTTQDPTTAAAPTTVAPTEAPTVPPTLAPTIVPTVAPTAAATTLAPLTTIVEYVTSSGVSAPEDTDMDFGETILRFFMIFLPNAGYMTASILGTWLQIFSTNVQTTLLIPLFNILGEVFDIPLNNGLFDMFGILEDVKTLVTLPFMSLTSMTFDNPSLAPYFIEPIITCLSSVVKSSQELLLAIFRVFPGCLGTVASGAIKIILNALRTIENLSGVFTTVMEGLNDCVADPFWCVFKLAGVSLNAIIEATVVVAQDIQKIVDLIPATGSAGFECLVARSTDLGNALPDIINGFTCNA